MTPLDLILLGFTALMALFGFYRGLIVGVLTLVGLGGGAFIGSRLGPLVLEEGAHSPFSPLFALGGAIVLGIPAASILSAFGTTLRRRLGERLGVLDGLGGAVLVGGVALGLAWLAGAVALQTPGAREFRRDVQRSQILRSLNVTLPPSGPILQALARFDPFPQIKGPPAAVRPPDSKIARDPDVRAAGRSVVRVLGTACGLGLQGSGWVAGDGVVVTNAHVVAGTRDTAVQLRGEDSRHDADVVYYDTTNDLAVLRSSGVRGVPALGLDPDADPGTSAAILGYPGNGPYEARPGRLGRTLTVISQNSYGRGPVHRRITTLRGRVRSGNSGGPMVDGQGRVVTTVFAAMVAARQASGFGVPDSIVGGALSRAGHGRVSTGPCGA